MATMRQFYEGKRFVKLVLTTPACPLDFNPRLVYSLLLGDYRHRQGVTKAWLARKLGIDESRTVPRCVKALRDHGLADQIDGLVHPLPPPEEGWFRRFEAAEKPWHETFRFLPVYLPGGSSPLSLREHALLGALGHKARGKFLVEGVTFDYLAKVLGLDPRTTSKGIGRLMARGLIKYVPCLTPGRFGVGLYHPRADQLEWFRNARPETVVPSDSSLDEFRQQRPPEAPGTHARPDEPDCDVRSSPESPLPEGRATDPVDLPPDGPPIVESRSGIHEIIRRENEQREERERQTIRERLESGGCRAGVVEKLVSRLHSESRRDFYFPNAERLGELIDQTLATPGLRSFEDMLLKRLEGYESHARADHERHMERMERDMVAQRLGELGPLVREPWEAYEDALTSPYDARLFLERVEEPHLGAWHAWTRTYGERVCREVLAGLPRFEPLDLDGPKCPNVRFEDLCRRIKPRPGA
jgi:hypothetical protein